MKRIAMWSGPRNISTAMMRSWENRPDTIVCDEPLYSHYLKRTGLPHPGAEDVIRCHESDWRKVVEWVTGPLPEGKSVFYQKQMAHHLLPEIDTAWLDQLTHCFLIREPREMLTSLVEFIHSPTIDDTGLPQQLRIFDLIRQRGGPPPVVLDAREVLLDPRTTLQRLCAAVDVDFFESMLQWRPGPRETDGVWAKYWYTKVKRTTTFGPYQPKTEPVPPRLARLLDECDSLYEQLASQRLSGGQGA